MLVASTTKSSRATPTAVDVRPAHAIDCRAVKDPGCARFDTGTVESMRAQERSSGHKPVLASSGTSTHSAAWDILLRESGKSKCTASTTLSKDTDSTQAKPASNAGRSTWLDWCKGDVESTLAGSDAGETGSRHRQLLEGRKKPDCRKSTTDSASPVLAKDCDGKAGPGPAPYSTRTETPNQAQLRENKKPVPRFSETNASSPSLESLTIDRLLSGREEPCDDKRTPSRPEPNAISTASEQEQLRRTAKVSRLAPFRTKGISPGQVLPDAGAELPACAEDRKGRGEPSFARFETEATEPQQENV